MLNTNLNGIPYNNKAYGGPQQYYIIVFSSLRGWMGLQFLKNLESKHTFNFMRPY